MADSVSADPRIGSEIAGYRVERLLGRGGMSVVYLAHDPRLDRRVALKLLAPELAEDGRFRERFLRESRLAASLDHPNVIPIHEAGEADGVLFIAMRFVEGTDLSRLIGEHGRLDPARAVAILERVASALDVAHGQGLVHRDVKPGNVLIARRGGEEHVYLSDFGLTKQQASESGITETGQFMGTADYVSPEQIEHRDVSGRADGYALACVLYECLTGDAPFRGESLMGVLWGHLNRDATPASEANPQLPGGIDAVLARGMAKGPEDRYASCGELAQEARSALGLSGEIVAPVGLRSRRRRRWIAGAVGLVLVVVAAVVAAVLATSGGEESAPLVVEGNSLVRLDSESGELNALVPLGARPDRVAVGEGALWVTSRDTGTASRVDPAGDVPPTTLSVPGQPKDVVVGDGWVWITSTDQGVGKLTRIDPESDIARRTIDLPLSDPNGVAVEDGVVWIAAAQVGRFGVLRVDPETMTVAATIEIPRPATPTGGGGLLQDIAVDESGVWATWDWGNRAVNLWRIDPDTNELVDEIELRHSGHVAAGEGAVWVADDLDTVTRYDPVTGDVTTVVGDPLATEGTRGVAIGEGSVWTANPGFGTVFRIDAATNGVETITIPASFDVDSNGPGPLDIAVDKEGVWVAVSAF